MLLDDSTPSEETSGLMPRVIFRSRRIFTRSAAIMTGTAIAALLVTMVLLIDDAMWRVIAIAGMLAVIAGFACVCAKHKLVTELAIDGEHLLVRTLLQGSNAIPLRIPVAETSDWLDYIETTGHYMMITRNRMVAFRHRGIRYGMAVDHAEHKI